MIKPLRIIRNQKYIIAVLILNLQRPLVTLTIALEQMLQAAWRKASIVYGINIRAWIIVVSGVALYAILVKKKKREFPMPTVARNSLMVVDMTLFAIQRTKKCLTNVISAMEKNQNVPTHCVLKK
jgi:hypothetical protein